MTSRLTSFCMWQIVKASSKTLLKLQLPIILDSLAFYSITSFVEKFAHRLSFLDCDRARCRLATGLRPPPTVLSFRLVLDIYRSRSRRRMPDEVALSLRAVVCQRLAAERCALRTSVRTPVSCLRGGYNNKMFYICLMVPQFCSAKIEPISGLNYYPTMFSK